MPIEQDGSTTETVAAANTNLSWTAVVCLHEILLNIDFPSVGGSAVLSHILKFILDMFLAVFAVDISQMIYVCPQKSFHWSYLAFEILCQSSFKVHHNTFASSPAPLIFAESAASRTIWNAARATWCSVLYTNVSVQLHKSGTLSHMSDGTFSHLLQWALF